MISDRREARREVGGTTLLFLSLAALGLGVALGLGPPRFEIVQPHLGAPAILRPGDSLAVEIRTSLPFWEPKFQLSLDGPSEKRELTFEDIVQSSFGTRRSLRASLPVDLATGGFDLRLTTEHRGRTGPRAVQIVDQYREDARFVQIADLPVIGDNGVGDAAIEAIIAEINLIAPDAVLFTGDLVYGEKEDCYVRLLEMIRRLGPPAIVAPGNHEYASWSQFRRYFSHPRHVVDYGGLYIVTLNSGHRDDQLTHSQLAWLRRAMASRPGRIPLLQIHHPLFGVSSVSQHARRVADELAGHRGAAALSGHVHHDAMFDVTGRARVDTWDFLGPKFASTTAAGSHDLRKASPQGPPAYPGYRLIRMHKGQVTSMTYDHDGDGVRDAASSYPFGMLRATSPKPGVVVVSNRLNEVIYRARVTTTVPGKSLGLRPSRGTLIDVRQEGNSTVYVAEVDLPSNGVTEIRFKKPGRT